MKKLLPQLELWLREQRDISGCLLVSALPIPLYCIFILLPSVAKAQNQNVFYDDMALISELFMSGVVIISSVIAGYCWRNRLSKKNYPWLSALTVYVVFSGAIVVSLAMGTETLL